MNTPATEASDAYPTGNDREVLLYLMQQFDAESWECPRCGHSEDTATMDSADYLRHYLAENPAPAAAVGGEWYCCDANCPQKNSADARTCIRCGRPGLGLATPAAPVGGFVVDEMLAVARDLDDLAKDGWLCASVAAEFIRSHVPMATTEAEISERIHNSDQFTTASVRETFSGLKPRLPFVGGLGTPATLPSAKDGVRDEIPGVVMHGEIDVQRDDGVWTERWDNGKFVSAIKDLSAKPAPNEIQGKAASPASPVATTETGLVDGVVSDEVVERAFNAFHSHVPSYGHQTGFKQQLRAALESVWPGEKGEGKVLWGVVANAGRLSDERKPRWSHVMEATGQGSTSSAELCRRFGFDPDETIGGERCESGDPECGPVEFHDSEGVPLCKGCWEQLAVDSADEAQPPAGKEEK